MALSPQEQERLYRESLAARRQHTPPDPVPAPTSPPVSKPVNPAQSVTPPRSAREFNADGSPTGRITNEAPETSRKAARVTSADSHRAIIRDALEKAGERGVTSIEVAALLPLTRQGGPQVSNRAASRLGELWELGVCAVVRENGRCVLGECHEHDKDRAVIHRPTSYCYSHGKPLARDGASVWVMT